MIRSKQKLAYMALGGALVFVGVLLSSMMNESRATGTVTTFDEIECKRLTITDAYGRKNIILTHKRVGGYGDPIISISDAGPYHRPYSISGDVEITADSIEIGSSFGAEITDDHIKIDGTDLKREIKRLQSAVNTLR